MKDVMLLTGAGQIGMAIARRMGYGMKIVVGDKKLENAKSIAKIMNDYFADYYSRDHVRLCSRNRCRLRQCE